MARQRAAAPDGETPLADKVAFLKRPASYPERPARVEAVETHMSWVFLTDRHAYKLKKPVRFDFLDFSSLAARRSDCAAEVRLNRRLAPAVYIGSVALTEDADGGLCLGGAGPAVDWMVKMHRLPGAAMLDWQIKTAAVDEVGLDAAAQLLAGFYARAAPAAIAPSAYVDRFERDVRANDAVLLEARYELPAERVRAVTDAQLGLLRERSALLTQRVRAGRVVEGHGDLRPEHICLARPPAVIDCLEFNKAFRILDPLEELSFLAMECELLGSARVGERFSATYRRATGDDTDDTLSAFYKAYRACLRCKLSLWHVSDPAVHDQQAWRRKALRYLALAEGYAPALSPG